MTSFDDQLLNRPALVVHHKITDVADDSIAGLKMAALYLRVQRLTIEGLLSGTHRAEHPDHQPDLNFKKAKAEANAAQKDLI